MFTTEPKGKKPNTNVGGKKQTTLYLLSNTEQSQSMTIHDALQTIFWVKIILYNKCVLNYKG
jgi:hypothetical protein